MFVRTWMSAPAVALDAETLVMDALEVMNVKRIRRVPVTREGELAGIVTCNDLLAILGPVPRPSRQRHIRLSHIMTTKVLTVEPGDTLEHASKIMLDHGVSGLPVVEQGLILGLITESDIFTAFNEIMGTSERGARIVMALREEEDLIESLTSRLRGLTVRSLAVVRDPKTRGWQVVARVAGRRPVPTAT